MDQADLLTIPVVPWRAEPVVPNAPSQLLLDFYDREQTPLKRYVAMLGVDPETARDVVQEAFLKLHEHLLAGGDQSNLRAWRKRYPIAPWLWVRRLYGIGKSIIP